MSELTMDNPTSDVEEEKEEVEVEEEGLVEIALVCSSIEAKLEVPRVLSHAYQQIIFTNVV